MKRQARINLAVLLAYQGKSEAAQNELRSYIDARYAENDGDDGHARTAKAFVFAARSRGIRSLLRALRTTRYRLMRRRAAIRVALVGGRSR